MKILCVEDNEKLARLTAENLRMNGNVVELANDLDTARHYTQIDTYDVIVLDRMLPGDHDGLELCDSLRKRGDNTPIIMLTALGDVDHRIQGFRYGADDYLAKPFDMDELLMRIKAVTRRVAQTTSVIVLNKDIVINLPLHEAIIKGQTIHLSKRLWSLLEYLALHPNQTISKELLIDRVWGMDRDILENTVEVAVRKLRAKLHDERGIIIQTVHGFGYRLNV